jgi:hypothetical protein
MTSVRFAAAFALVVCLHSQPRQDVRTVEASRYEYTLRMGGTEDAANTRDPIVYAAWKPGYEPMRSVKLENTGTADVVNPWLTVNGKRNWRTVADIVAEALGTYGDPAAMTDRDKARAIWEFFRTHRFHATTGDLDVRDPVKMLNVYGFALCGDNAPVLMELWRAAGLRARRGYPIAHCVSETWYDGGWHMLDADESVLFLDRDNRTILPENAVARDHDLSKRAYQSQSLAALYNYDATHTGDFPSHEQHRMDFTLRPGESIEWRFGQGEKFHYAPTPVLFLLESADLHRWGANAWATLRNGRWRYTARTGGPWKIRTPYVIVGGKVEAAAGSNFSASLDGREWKRIPANGDLGALFPAPGDAHYEFVVRRDSGAGTVTIEAELQMAPLAMPQLELGENRVRYVDQTAGAHAVKISFDWVERGTSQPPVAPARAADLHWTEVANAAAYHFELSDEPSIRWPLSPAYTVVQPGRAWSPLTPGLLNPGQTYYWRVRAKSRAGIWGPWSTTFQHVPEGPATPLRPRFEERDPDRLTLVWDAAPKAVRYRIYASDEKGFSASDQPYEVATGGSKNGGYFAGKSSVTFDANFVAETGEPGFRVAPQRAFWRVVAVDAEGRRSGSSDYVEAPRPWIYTTPVRTVRIGQPYRYEPKTIRSIGDLTFHHSFPDGQGQDAFWTADQPVFSFEDEMPRCGNFEAKWLHLDPKTGVLSGTPGADAAGEYQVNLRVEIGGRAHIQSFPLIVTK